MLDLQWPFKRHSEVFAGTQQYAKEQGWHSIIDEFAYETLASNPAKRERYDGILARANQLLFKQAARLRIPLVNVWASSPVRDRLPSVVSDYASAGQICAEHLLTRGFHNFATLTTRTHAQSQIVREFTRSVKEFGHACAEEHCLANAWESVELWRKIERTIQHCVNTWQPPIGVYVSDEGVGRLLVQACHRRGWRVPADVAIIAGQNEETLCVHPSPSLTSIEYGFERVGYEAARMLHRLMDGKTPPSPLLLPPRGLVVRESTDFYAVNNEAVSQALAFIAGNCHRSIGQDDVAQAIGFETRTLQNYFRKYLGRPVVAEIRRARVERAKRELAQSNRPLADIANSTGFGDAMRMCEVFRREMGVTPTQYRKQRQLEKYAPDA